MENTTNAPSTYHRLGVLSSFPLSSLVHGDCGCVVATLTQGDGAPSPAAASACLGVVSAQVTGTGSIFIVGPLAACRGWEFLVDSTEASRTSHMRTDFLGVSLQLFRRNFRVCTLSLPPPLLHHNIFPERIHVSGCGCVFRFLWTGCHRISASMIVRQPSLQ